MHRGIVDGGNQSGIPVAAGAFLFDESYLGKPLVFCGTGGVLPARIRGRDSCEKQVRPGDLAVMTGGRIGKDGIHGATFSSEALSESSPTSAVQIGDPITQKKMLDMLLEARDRGTVPGHHGQRGRGSFLLPGGDGGPERRGVDRPGRVPAEVPGPCRLGDPGERIPGAHEPRRPSGKHRRVSRAGEASGRGGGGRRGVHRHGPGGGVLRGATLVGMLDLDFLHGGLPVMDLRAEWTPTAAPSADQRPPSADDAALAGLDLTAIMLDLVADPNVRSREEWVRCYDHEVQARSVVKPFVGRRRDGPSDGAVFLVRHDSTRGITITHGICPRYGDHDTYDMAQCAVDEAVRAHVALGGDPRQMAALDNFCWPDPVESPETRTGPSSWPSSCAPAAALRTPAAPTGCRSSRARTR